MHKLNEKLDQLIDNCINPTTGKPYYCHVANDEFYKLLLLFKEMLNNQEPKDY